jgi:hypothetical protein
MVARATRELHCEPQRDFSPSELGAINPHRSVEDGEVDGERLLATHIVGRQRCASLGQNTLRLGDVPPPAEASSQR